MAHGFLRPVPRLRKRLFITYSFYVEEIFSYKRPGVAPAAEELFLKLYRTRTALFRRLGRGKHVYQPRANWVASDRPVDFIRLTSVAFLFSLSSPLFLFICPNKVPLSIFCQHLHFFAPPPFWVAALSVYICSSGWISSGAF